MNKHVQEAIRLVGTQEKLAIRCGYTQPAIHAALTGKVSISPRLAMKIEKATFGFVTRAELCPELFAGDRPLKKRRFQFLGDAEDGASPTKEPA